MAAPKRKRKQGGRREGSGRPPSPTQQILVTVKNETAAKLTRAARARGLRKIGGGKPFLGTVIDELVERHLEAPEPEYLKIAREAKTRN